MGKKNYGKSVKTRLLNLMNETGYKYMYLLARYFNERLLYRVSVSQYKDNFLLKKLPMHPKTGGMGRINDIAIRDVAKLSGKGVSTVQRVKQLLTVQSSQ